MDDILMCIRRLFLRTLQSGGIVIRRVCLLISSFVNIRRLFRIDIPKVTPSQWVTTLTFWGHVTSSGT